MPNREPIELGEFVQNNGFFQLWVGKVVKFESPSYLVRITFVTGKYKKRWDVGESVWMLSHEFKRPKGKSASAIYHGAFRD